MVGDWLVVNDRRRNNRKQVNANHGKDQLTFHVGSNSSSQKHIPWDKEK